NKKKHLKIKCENFYQKLLSIETIAEGILEIDKLKRILFQGERLGIYETIDLYSSNQDFFKYWIETERNYGLQDYEKFKNSEDYLTRILLNKCIEK
ncbi:MAG: hypothetical protein ACKO46_03985, partial [Alphaproteobacteria bacterium]